MEDKNLTVNFDECEVNVSLSFLLIRFHYTVFRFIFTRFSQRSFLELGNCSAQFIFNLSSKKKTMEIVVLLLKTERGGIKSTLLKTISSTVLLLYLSIYTLKLIVEAAQIDLGALPVQLQKNDQTCICQSYTSYLREMSKTLTVIPSCDNFHFYPDGKNLLILR